MRYLTTLALPLRPTFSSGNARFAACRQYQVHKMTSNGDHVEKASEPQPASEAHRHQAGSTTHRDLDEWKHREPYRIHDTGEVFPVKWKGGCHCGRVKYQLSRERPLVSKYCHCTTCQRLHGAPFQWSTIFHKKDINFTHGHHDLGWYDPTAKSQTHHLPCKVQCAFCRTPIMDEGRNMILLYPTLIEGIETPEARKAFESKCHMFYHQRVVDFKGDGIAKWSGLEGESDLLDDDGNVVKKRKQDKGKD